MSSWPEAGGTRRLLVHGADRGSAAHVQRGGASLARRGGHRHERRAPADRDDGEPDAGRRLAGGNITVARNASPDIFYSERIAGDAPLNAFDADRSELDELAEIARNAGDETEAAEAWADVYAAAADGGPIIVINHIVTGAAIEEYVTGAQTPPGSLIPNVRNIRVDGEG